MSEKNVCFCCKKEREGTWAEYYKEKEEGFELVWICNVCNHMGE